MKDLKCAIFISDVGFGHMVRQRQIIAELFKHFKKISITVFHKKNIQILKKSFGRKINYVENFNNIELKKKPSGLLDLKKTKKVFNNWKKRSDIFLKKRSHLLSKFDFFISDLVPEVSFYAFKNQKPCFSICHYTWDWFFTKVFEKTNKDIKLIEKYTNLSSKIYFPPLTHSKILKNKKSIKNVNFIANKIFKKKINKNLNKILIMNNGTEVLSTKIKNLIPELIKIKEYEFYISTPKLNKILIKKINLSENVNIIKNDLKNIYNYIPKVNYIIARGGYNTITECLLSKKPSLLAEEKFNPEIDENLKSIKTIKFFEILRDEDWSPKRFKQRLIKFIFNQKKHAKHKKNSLQLKNDGAKTIVLDIKKYLKKI